MGWGEVIGAIAPPRKLSLWTWSWTAGIASSANGAPMGAALRRSVPRLGRVVVGLVCGGQGLGRAARAGRSALRANPGGVMRASRGSAGEGVRASRGSALTLSAFHARLSSSIDTASPWRDPCSSAAPTVSWVSICCVIHCFPASFWRCSVPAPHHPAVVVVRLPRLAAPATLHCKRNSAAARRAWLATRTSGCSLRTAVPA